ncbi:MAG: hypothetical protein LQ344_006068 [Seirophora lacunosa]|nr:MAG: hypothetical protein LQ344_006068 [Seirophora lacunosa]
MASSQAPNDVARQEDDLQHPSRNDWNPYAIIQSYLTSSLEPDATASALTTPINDILASDSSETDDTPCAEDIWSALLSHARHHHPLSQSIPALIALLAAIKASPSGNTDQPWRQLPSFGMTVREEWNRTISPSASDADPWSCTPVQWASMNAFVALCTVAGVEDFKLYAIWALRAALEDVPGQRSKVGHVADLDHWVPAAAAWVLCAGEVMYREWLGGAEKGSRAASGGMLWEGEGFDLGRWRFWSERLRWVGAQREVDVEEETREWARWAADRMEEVERVEKPGAEGVAS